MAKTKRTDQQQLDSLLERMEGYIHRVNDLYSKREALEHVRKHVEQQIAGLDKRAEVAMGSYYMVKQQAVTFAQQAGIDHEFGFP